MYDRRVKVFIALNVALVLLYLVRLVQMQWLRDPSIQADIDRLKRQQLRSIQLKTVRGSILDRNGRVLAADVPQFQITLSYNLSCYADKRVQEAKRLEAQKRTRNPSGVDIENEIAGKLEDLKQIITDCNELGADAADVAERISRINNRVWSQRTFLAWWRNDPDPNLLTRYDNEVERVPLSQALADFQRHFPDPEVRLQKILRVNAKDVTEATTPFALMELATEDDRFRAQLQFLDSNDVQVASVGARIYPYGSTAAQTIGWVGAPTVARDVNLFEKDPLARYLGMDDVCGREDGVEYVCEAVLRGRRGEEVSDTDTSLVRWTQPEFGKNVPLTIDIELQKQIEEFVTDPERNPNYDADTAVVVLDVRSGDILALVSLPTYDLNRVRYDYGDLSDPALSPGRPLINRAINALYPPGSVVKPLVLAAGLQSGAIQPDEIIHCPHAPAPPGWPDCLIYRQGGAHDWLWANDARHAIQGSCNIYFSHLADRLEPRLLQQWLFKFGYGHQLLGKCDVGSVTDEVQINNRTSNFRLLKESAGQLGSTNIPATLRVDSLDQIPPLNPAERRYFGIGQGNLRVTPLQVANSFAALARGGQYRPPRLFKSDPLAEPVDLGISLSNLQVIHDGLSAVVNEPHGTAYEAFRNSDLASRGVKAYGKTGSTERPEHAWFAGFAEDPSGARIALAVVVEGGEHGSRDAAPLGKDIIEICAQAGYVGQ
jgi:penicillin-binding protein 2